MSFVKTIDEKQVFFTESRLNECSEKYDVVVVYNWICVDDGYVIIQYPEVINTEQYPYQLLFENSVRGVVKIHNIYFAEKPIHALIQKIKTEVEILRYKE